MKTSFRKLNALVLMLLYACNSTSYNPQNGDLLFQVAGESNFSEAIVNTTARLDSLQFDHVGIVCCEQGKPYVIEASAKRGVVCTSFNDFIASSIKMNGGYGIIAKRVNSCFSAEEAVLRAKSHLGEAYDWTYSPNNGKMYCSELVYESFRDSNGNPIFTERPMNFRNLQGKFPDFWIKLFNELGDTIPQGLPGTNPNDISKEPVITEVYRFF